MITNDEFSKLRSIIKEEANTALEEKLKPIHKKLNKIDRDLKATNHYFDGRIIGHEKRITKIESHLNISTIL